MTGHQIEAGDRQNALRRKSDDASHSEGQAPVHPLLTLQSQIGNAQVARLLAQREDEKEDEKGGEAAQAKHDLAQRESDDENGNENVGVEGGPVGAETAQRIHSARGGGSALDGGTRASMEG